MTGPESTAGDPLAPIEFVITCMSALIGLLFAAVVAFTVFGSGSLFGLGEPEACAQVAVESVPFGGGEGPGAFHIQGLRADARFFPAALQICREHPSTRVKAAAAAGPAATFALLVGFLILARLLIRTARRHGLFTSEVAARTRLLGWWLFVGSLGAAALEAVARGIVTASAVDHIGWTDGLSRIDVPWTVAIVGIGVLSFARVLRQAVALQDEVDATI